MRKQVIRTTVGGIVLRLSRSGFIWEKGRVVPATLPMRKTPILGPAYLLVHLPCSDKPLENQDRMIATCHIAGF